MISVSCERGAPSLSLCSGLTTPYAPDAIAEQTKRKVTSLTMPASPWKLAVRQRKEMLAPRSRPACIGTRPNRSMKYMTKIFIGIPAEHVTRMER